MRFLGKMYSHRRAKREGREAKFQKSKWAAEEAWSHPEKRYDSAYYKNEDWLERTQMLVGDAGHTCEKCHRKFDRKNLSIHHKTYEHKPHEEPDDTLQCLCKDCHYTIHEVQNIIHGHRSNFIDADCLKVERHQEKEIMALLEKYTPWILGGERDFQKIKKEFYGFVEKREAFRHPWRTQASLEREQELQDLIERARIHD